MNFDARTRTGDEGDVVVLGKGSALNLDEDVLELNIMVFGYFRIEFNLLIIC